MRFTGWVRGDEDRLFFQIARQLKSPNTWQGRHWRVKDADTKGWEAALLGVVRADGYRVGLPRQPRESRRMRVTITRLVPTRRSFIRDTDNLSFSAKPLNDALRRLGLIHDDSQAWLEEPIPDQCVSPGRLHWTIVVIEPA